MRKLLIILAAVLTSLLIQIEAKAEDSQERYERYVEQICSEYNCCPELVEAIIEHESHWDPKAKNKSCKGLMQINEKFHKERMKKLNVQSLYNPYGNILVGVDYIMELAEKYEDIGTVLNIYNAGNKGLELAKQGKYLSYTKWIIKRSEELEKMHGK